MLTSSLGLRLAYDDPARTRHRHEVESDGLGRHDGGVHEDQVLSRLRERQGRILLNFQSRRNERDQRNSWLRSTLDCPRGAGLLTAAQNTRRPTAQGRRYGPGDAYTSLSPTKGQDEDGAPGVRQRS